MPPRVALIGTRTLGEPAAEATRVRFCQFRRLSGLEWPEVAALFGVTLREVHRWASGAPMPPEHVAALDRHLDLVQAARLPADMARVQLFGHVAGPLRPPREDRRPLPVDVLLSAEEDTSPPWMGPFRPARVRRVALPTMLPSAEPDPIPLTDGVPPVQLE